MNTHSQASNKPGFADSLRLIRHRAEGENLTLFAIVETLGDQGYGFLTLFLSIPFLQPIPLVGLSTPFGLAIAFVGACLAFDRPIWLPARIGRVEVRRSVVISVCAALEKLMRRIERFVRPRAESYFEKGWFRAALGTGLILHAGLLSLPLPIPFSNFFPALVLVLLSLGLLEKDAGMILAGAGAIAVNLVYFTLLVLLPLWGIRAL